MKSLFIHMFGSEVGMKLFLLVSLLLIVFRVSLGQPITNVALPAAETILTIDPKNTWTATNAIIFPGDNFEVFVSGVAAPAATDIGSWCGPMGNGFIGDGRFPLPGYSTYSVIGKVGVSGTPFFVGEHLKTQYSGASSGTLYLGYNDIVTFADNDGMFLAHVLKMKSANYWVVSLDPRNAWTTTGIQVTTNDTLDIRVMGIASSASTDQNAWVGNWGNGYPTDGRFALSGVSQYSVIARVGSAGAPFLVGGRTTFTYTGTTGILDIGFNDIVNFSDNGGWCVVYVTKLNGVRIDQHVVAVEGSDEGTLPKTFVLEQNFPNPFNPSTTIRFALPERARVNLVVYNSLGQQVLTLLDGEREPGFHEVKFDASRLASGAYFYQLKAGRHVEAKQLLLMR